jgi:hypothetical protein
MKRLLSVRIPEEVVDGMDTMISIGDDLSRGGVIEGLWKYLIENHSMSDLLHYLNDTTLEDGRKNNGRKTGG